MGYVLYTWPFLGADIHGPSWACPAISRSCTLISPLGRLGCPHIYIGPHPRTCLIGPSIFVCLGTHRPCALCFRALCPGIAQINTPAPNSMQRTNKSMRGHKQSDKTCTHQTTRGNNESLNLGPSLLFGSLYWFWSLFGPSFCHLKRWTQESREATQGYKENLAFTYSD